jgi:primase-polymerase (primpol)-like protein
MELLLDSIPSELKASSKWVLWKRNREGKKPPYSALTGKAVDITDPDAGSTFEQALNALQKLGRFDGIGYILNGSERNVQVNCPKSNPP